MRCAQKMIAQIFSWKSRVEMEFVSFLPHHFLLLMKFCRKSLPKDNTRLFLRCKDFRQDFFAEGYLLHSFLAKIFLSREVCWLPYLCRLNRLAWHDISWLAWHWHWRSYFFVISRPLFVRKLANVHISQETRLAWHAWHVFITEMDGLIKRKKKCFFLPGVKLPSLRELVLVSIFPAKVAILTFYHHDKRPIFAVMNLSGLSDKSWTSLLLLMSYDCKNVWKSPFTPSLTETLVSSCLKSSNELAFLLYRFCDLKFFFHFTPVFKWSQ